MKRYRIALREYSRHSHIVKVGRAPRIRLSSTEMTEVDEWTAYWAKKEPYRFLVEETDDGKPEPKPAPAPEPKKVEKKKEEKPAPSKKFVIDEPEKSKEEQPERAGMASGMQVGGSANIRTMR